MIHFFTNFLLSSKTTAYCCAVKSRILVTFLQFVFNHLLPDHEAADVFIAPIDLTEERYYGDSVIEFVLGGFRRWDAQYFLHIAENGYIYENSLAFYPLFPYITRYIALIVNPLCFGLVSFRSLLLLCAVLVNIVCFSFASKTLYEMSLIVFKGDRKLCKLVVILFCFNPSSVFFSAPYSESLFALTTLLVMKQSLYNNLSCYTVIPLVLSVLCRSNGLINMGFIFYAALKNVVQNKKSLFRDFQICVAVILSVGVVYGTLQYYYYQLYCTNNDKTTISVHLREYAVANQIVLAGLRNNSSSPWCDYKLPISYTYIQNHYWNVGFLKYYTIRQLPNFLIATPILSFLGYNIYKYFVNILKLIQSTFNVSLKNKEISINQFVFAVHGLFLTMTCIFYMHIQVSNRFLACSSPLLFWYVAKMLLVNNKDININNFSVNTIILFFNESKTFCSKFLVIWFLGYFIIGIAMFCNNLPWT